MPHWTFKGSNRAAGKAPRLANGFRSGLEKRIADDLESRGISFRYEKEKLAYTVPAREAKYTPDFILDNGIIIEAKGIFECADRAKHLLVREAHPQLDIRFVFQRASQPIRKGSPTTYAAWCDKHGFKFAEKLIPSEWAREAPRPPIN